MPTPAWCLALLLFLVVPLRADDSLDHARRAQALLGSGIWSRVIRVQNEARNNEYPGSFHALVFELSGILWFYSANNGTQSFSLHQGALAEEKADFGPGLRDIHAGLTGWSIVPDGGAPAVAGKLPHGCFVECVALLRERAARGGVVGRAQLLSYYVRRASGWRGHTVLALAGREEVEVLDPLEPGRSVRLPAADADDALGLARGFRGGAVAKAHLLPVELPVEVPGRAAAPLAAASSGLGPTG